MIRSGFKLMQRCSARAAVATRAFATDGSPQRLMYPVISKEDFGAYKEYSVIHTDRSLNLMSDPFQRVMRDLNQLLKVTYNCEKVAIIPGKANGQIRFLASPLYALHEHSIPFTRVSHPKFVFTGSGTYGMEAVARQFATNEHVMVLRNGWFSFRWTEIFDMGGEGMTIPSSHTVLKAQPVATTDGSDHTHFAPYPIEDVVKKILEERPAAFFCPHIETSTGMILPDWYIKQAAEAVHQVGGLFVLDCIASGTVWVDMKETGVDVLISAPQKGWTGREYSEKGFCVWRVQVQSNDHVSRLFSSLCSVGANV